MRKLCLSLLILFILCAWKSDGTKTISFSQRLLEVQDSVFKTIKFSNKREKIFSSLNRKLRDSNLLARIDTSTADYIFIWVEGNSLYDKESIREDHFWVRDSLQNLDFKLKLFQGFSTYQELGYNPTRYRYYGCLGPNPPKDYKWKIRKREKKNLRNRNQLCLLINKVAGYINISYQRSPKNPKIVVENKSLDF